MNEEEKPLRKFILRWNNKGKALTSRAVIPPETAEKLLAEWGFKENGGEWRNPKNGYVAQITGDVKLGANRAEGR